MGYRKQNSLTVDGILYADANKVTSSTNAGTATQVLTSNGPGVAPTYQAVSASGAVTTLTGNTGGAIAPVAGNINTVGSGSITTAGAGSTLTTQLTGLTNHAVLVGAGTATITKVGPTATIGQVLQSAGAAADPAFSTATYPLTTTINQLLYSSAANTVTGLSTANRGVLTTGATGVPVITALATDGQVIIGSTAGAPAAATLTAGSGISITNGSNSITVAVSGTGVGQTITGDTGGALSPTAGNWNFDARPSAGSSVSFSGSGSTLTLNTSDASLNTFIGLDCGNTTLSGNSNSGFGEDVLEGLTSGSNNSAFGRNSLDVASTASNNSAYGNGSLQSLQSGTGNYAFGNNAGSSYTTSESNNIVIGNTGTIADSAAIRIGTSGTHTKAFMAGVSGVSVANQAITTINTSTGQLGSAAFSVVTQVFSASGTYTPTSGMKYCKVRQVGGGGAGGGAPVTSGTQTAGGGGGGSGEYAEGTFSSATIGASQTVTIGAAGTPNSGAAGGNGGTTSLGALITCGGGIGGLSSTAGIVYNGVSSLGGSGGSGGSFRTPGRQGGYSFGVVSTSFQAGGQGADSQFGAGGLAATANSAGVAALGYGAGGSGALNFTSQSARSGGAGTAGIIVIDEYVII